MGSFRHMYEIIMAGFRFKWDRKYINDTVFPLLPVHKILRTLITDFYTILTD